MSRDNSRVPQATAMRDRTAAKPRIIFNDDTCSLRFVPQPHTEEGISQALDYLKGTQVGWLCWSFMGFDVAYSWRSSVMENFYDRIEARRRRSMQIAGSPGGSPTVLDLGGPTDLTVSLYRRGIDYLPLLIRKAHENGLQFCASFRMNDAHHKGDPRGVGASQFWREHQEYRLWEVTDDLAYYNACLDYSRAEVRNRRYRAMKEVCEKYDLDAVELDFCRHPYLFQPSEAWKKRGLLTRFIEKIADMLDAVGRRRGRKIRLIIRTPFQQELLTQAGMDVAEWVDRKRMDVLVMSDMTNNFNRTVEPWLTRCRRRGILFYPGLQLGLYLNPQADTHLPTTLKGLEWSDALTKTTRALAQNFLAQRVDGVYMFNYPCALFETSGPRPPAIFKKLAQVLCEVGDLARLKGAEKLYEFYHDLPVTVESRRPPQYHQTIRFRILDADLRNPATRVRLRFRQAARKSPHAYVHYEPKPRVAQRVLRCYLNGWEIGESRMKKTLQPAGSITGFQLPRHELVEADVPSEKLVVGENTLAFQMPALPRETDPYIDIYDFMVTVAGGGNSKVCQ